MNTCRFPLLPAFFMVCFTLAAVYAYGAPDEDRLTQCRIDCCQKAMSSKYSACGNACEKITENEKRYKCHEKCLAKRNARYRACLRSTCRMSKKDIELEPGCGS